MGILRESKPKRNDEITCSCTCCAYHDGECTCTADKVSVGPATAKCCADTVCATFRKKNS